MRIETGKRYIDAYGDIITIVRKTENIDYVFVDNECFHYTKEGYYYSNKTISGYDLICEVDESILKEYKNESINKYEFLLRHYLKYGGDPKCLTKRQINTN